ncbi:MAG: tripartite tricarboxylate transporter substrate binding protein [Pseudomonadota bacterium]
MKGGDEIMRYSYGRIYRATTGAVCSLALAVTLGATTALAEYPEKPITMLVGWAPGGSADISARVLAEMAEKELGQKIVVQNVPGGASSVATLQAKNAEADGYTILNNWVAGHVAVRLFNPEVGYDIDSFEPITGSVRLPFTITVASSNPANNLTEFAEWAEGLGRPVNVSICGAVSVPRMVGEEVLARIGVKNINPVAYEGCMPDAMKDMISGSLDAAVGVLPATKVFKDKVKHLAVITDARDPLSPDVPTAKEQGFDIGWGLSSQGWAGVAVKKGVPEERVARLQEVFGNVAKSDAFRDKLAELNFNAMYLPPDKFSELWNASAVALAPAVERLSKK